MKSRWYGIKGLDGSVYGASNERFVVVVKAKQIDKTHFRYVCPFCKKTHRHGSEENLGNRTTYRSTHCQANRKHDVEIIIDDNTTRN